MNCFCNVAAKCVRSFFYSAFNRGGWLNKLPKDILTQINIIFGDSGNPNGAFQATKGCDAAFLLAAHADIPLYYHSHDPYVGQNINGALNVLQAKSPLGRKCILVNETPVVYRADHAAPIDEKYSLQGRILYSACKIRADRLVESFSIPAGHGCRLKYFGILELPMIEVQSDQQLGKDDTACFQENFGRARCSVC